MTSRRAGNEVTSNREIAGQTCADVARALVLLRVAARAVDRLAESSSVSTIHPELALALIESSQSGQRALVMLGEANQLLAESGVFQGERAESALAGAGRHID